MRTTVLFVALMVICSGVTFAQDVPVVTANMVEISFDAVGFVLAESYVSNIEMLTGAVTAEHINHSRRGDLNIWEGQLGVPFEDQKVRFVIDTNIFPAGVRRYQVRFKFAVESPVGSGNYIYSPVTEPSPEEKLIGKPKKPVRTE